MTIPKITPYSGGVANPDGSQTQTEFTQNMFDQLIYEAELSTELNNTIDGINDTATQVDADATSAAQSASAAEAAVSGLNYQGLWPDTGGSANKGDTYQTQVSGTPTGQYFTALQNTTVNPVSDDVNWRAVLSVEKGDKRYGSTFNSVSDMRNGLTIDGTNINWSKLVGSSVKWNGYYSASDGGSNWGIVKAGTITDDGGSLFQVAVGYYVEANLKGFRTSVAKFGAQGDGGITSRETNSVAFEKAIAYLESTNQVKLYVPTGRVGSKLYTMQREVSLEEGMTLYGDGMRESFLNFPAGVNGVVLRGDCKLKDIGLEAVLDNTKFQNGVTVSGDTANRPYRVFISRVYVGNFYRVIESNWMWASVIKSVHSINSGKGIDAKGITVNNVLKSCQLAGRNVSNDDAAVLIGDGTLATEGWMITQMLTFGFGIGLHLNKCSHCAMSNNIWDFCYKHGVLYSGVSINNKIVNDYFGMSNGAITGYYANQNADNPQSKGNKISQCDIVAYGTLQTGLRLSQYEHNSRVDKVSVDACSSASIAVEGSPRNVRVTGCNFESDNATFGNNGQVRESLVYWSGNTGGIASSYVTIKFDDGLSVARYVSNTPSNGDYEVGDIAINRGTANVVTHKWVCTVAGTAGVDAVFKQIDYA